MKKTFTFFRAAKIIFLPLLLWKISYSQITYQANDYAAPGDSFMVSISPESLMPFYNFDTTGANFSWNFDTLDALTQQYKIEETPNSTGYKNAFLYGIPFIIPGCIEQCTDTGGGLFPCTSGCTSEWNQLTNANLTWDTINLRTVKIYDLYNFYAKTANTYERRLIGYKVDVSGLSSPLTTEFSSPDIIYNFPITYNDQDSSESAYTIDLGLPFIYKHWQKRVNYTDGWGSLKTPYGTFNNTLRVKSFIYNDDKFIFDTGDTIALSTILPDSTIEYKWFDVNFGIPVLTVTAKIIQGIPVYLKAEYVDSLRCLHPAPLFGYLPIPTYLNIDNDSVEVNFYSFAANSDSLRWNFGDSASGIENFSNESHPSHWYTSQGVYLVQLIGCNTSEQCDSLICDTFALPVAVIDTTSIYANFIAKPLFPCSGDSVVFTNTSVNDTAWFWNFDDGTTHTAENPVHIFTSSGTYNVMLVAYNGFQSDTVYKNIVISSTPSASFTYSDTLTIVPVQFTNISSGTDTSATYLWTFGGGKPSAGFSLQENPIITFENPGNVNACLLVINSLGCSNAFCDSIEIYQCLNAKFKTNGLSASFCVNSNIVLTNQTTSDLSNTITYQWLADGILFSSSTNASKSFAVSGTHIITLVADNGVCSDTMILEIQIKEYAQIFSLGNDTTICLGDSVFISPQYTLGGQNGSTSWNPLTGLSFVNNNSMDVWSEPNATTSYIFTISIPAGACDGLLFTKKDTITIGVDSCLTEQNEFANSFNLKIYPNPFQKTTMLSYTLNEKAIILIEVYNALGEKINVVVNGTQNEGSYIFPIDILNQENISGIYFARIKINERRVTIPLVIY